MKRLMTLASMIALTAAPSVVFAGGYQWTNDTETIHGAMVMLWIANKRLMKWVVT